MPAHPDPIALLAMLDAGLPDEQRRRRADRMARSALQFYRSALPIMTHNLAGTTTSEHVVQLNGDANLANFGLYMAADGRLCFGLTDFQNSHPGPWEWDVLRLVVDLVVSGRTHGFNGAQRHQAVVRTVRRYRRATLGFVALSEPQLRRARPDEDEMRRLRDFGQAAHLITTRSGRPLSLDRSVRQSTRMPAGRLRQLVDDGQAPPCYHQVRQLHDPLVSAEVVKMASFTMAAYGELCAWALALSHARTGDRFALAAHLSTEQGLEQRLAATAEDYADQNERDHRRFAAAVSAPSAALAFSH